MRKRCKLFILSFRCKQIGIGYNERGFVRYLKVDFVEAIADYSKALSYDPSLYFTQYNRGLIHYRLGRCWIQVFRSWQELRRFTTKLAKLLIPKIT